MSDVDDSMVTRLSDELDRLLEDERIDRAIIRRCEHSLAARDRRIHEIGVRLGKDFAIGWEDLE